MSRTRRIYNRIRKHIIPLPYGLGDFYHPYGWICCGHCSMCKDKMKLRREKLHKRIEARRDIVKSTETVEYVSVHVYSCALHGSWYDNVDNENPVCPVCGEAPCDDYGVIP